MRDGEDRVCGREDMKEDRVLGVGQAVKIMKGVHCRKVATEDFRRDQRGSQYHRPGWRSNNVYSLLRLCSLMLKAGE